MERPYEGRAILQDNFTDLQIIIPAKRNWFVLLFLGAWICGWVMGELFAIGSLTGLLFGKSVGSLFILFWLVGWTVGGFFAFNVFLWNLRGKEIVTIGQGTLSIVKKGALIGKSKTYDLKEVKNMRVQDDAPDYGIFGRRNDLAAFKQSGIIRFDYGFKTIKFADGIDEAEANYLLEKMKEKHFIAAV